MGKVLMFYSPPKHVYVYSLGTCRPAIQISNTTCFNREITKLNMNKTHLGWSLDYVCDESYVGNPWSWSTKRAQEYPLVVTDMSSSKTRGHTGVRRRLLWIIGIYRFSKFNYALAFMRFVTQHAMGKFSRRQIDDIFLYFSPESWIWPFMQTVSWGNNLYKR